MFSLEHEFYGDIQVDQDDVIMRHEEERYDHIRVLFPAVIEDGEGDTYQLFQMRAVFAGKIALDAFAEVGVPEAYLDEPTEMTINAYESDVLTRLDFEV